MFKRAESVEGEKQEPRIRNQEARHREEAYLYVLICFSYMPYMVKSIRPATRILNTELKKVKNSGPYSLFLTLYSQS